MKTILFPTLMIIVLLAASADAHPAHVSFAELEFNKTSGHIEIALKVCPEDLERALALQERRRVQLEQEPELDRRVLTYLQRAFVILDRDGTPRALRWVGKELSAKELWIFLEVPASGLVGLDMRNALFFELAPDQVNTVLVKAAGVRNSLTFTRSRARRPLA